jgi:ABC-type oligopeptide transport system ATPase subunit
MSAATTPLLRASHLVKEFGGSPFDSHRVPMRAVNDVSFEIGRGEILGLVGESGSGKSTTGRLVLRLDKVTTGSIAFDGHDISQASRKELKAVRRRMQVVFQDPYAALSPRLRVGDFVAEPFKVHGIGTRSERADRVAELFRKVGLDPSLGRRYPHEFSGGQRQRICIARALAPSPSLIVADEPITALDVSIQAQIVNLFKDLQQEMGLSYLFIAHDLSMVRYLCHRVAVMWRGRIVEIGPTASVFGDARHPYTRSLISAIPIPDPDIEVGRHRIPFGGESIQANAALVECGPDHFVLM